MGYLTVKIVRVGAPTVEVTVQDGDSVEAALSAANIEIDNNAQLRYDGANVTRTTALRASGTLLVTKPIAGA